jgi:hypothetical protein
MLSIFVYMHDKLFSVYIFPCSNNITFQWSDCYFQNAVAMEWALVDLAVCMMERIVSDLFVKQHISSLCLSKANMLALSNHN